MGFIAQMWIKRLRTPTRCPFYLGTERVKGMAKHYQIRHPFTIDIGATGLVSTSKHNSILKERYGVEDWQDLPDSEKSAFKAKARNLSLTVKYIPAGNQDIFFTKNWHNETDLTYLAGMRTQPLYTRSLVGGSFDIGFGEGSHTYYTVDFHQDCCDDKGKIMNIPKDSWRKTADSRNNLSAYNFLRIAIIKDTGPKSYEWYEEHRLEILNEVLIPIMVDVDTQRQILQVNYGDDFKEPEWSEYDDISTWDFSVYNDLNITIK